MTLNYCHRESMVSVSFMTTYHSVRHLHRHIKCIHFFLKYIIVGLLKYNFAVVFFSLTQSHDDCHSDYSACMLCSKVIDKKNSVIHSRRSAQPVENVINFVIFVG